MFSSHSINSRTHFSGPWERRELKESPIHGPMKKVSPLKLLPLGRAKKRKSDIYNNDSYLLFYCYHFIYSEELFYGHIALLVIISGGKAYFLERLLQANRDNRLEITHFKFLRKLGSGSFGTVFLAKHPVRDELVAVKKILAVSMDQVQARTALRIMIEKEASCHIQGSSHVIQLLDTFTITLGSKQAFYFVYEFADGGDLSDLILRIHYGIGNAKNCSQFYLGKWSENFQSNPYIKPFTKYLIPQMLLGISALHERGIIHLDLKPENMLITKKGILKISDLGLVKRYRWFHYSARAEFLTSLRKEVKYEPHSDENYVAGTIAYMEPELRGTFINSHQNVPENLFDYQVTYSADYFSLGIIAFELMTGFIYGFKQSYVRKDIRLLLEHNEGLPLVAWHAYKTYFPASLIKEMKEFSMDRLHDLTNNNDEGIVDLLISSCKSRKKRWSKYTISVKVKREGQKIEENIICVNKMQSQIPLFRDINLDSLAYFGIPEVISEFLNKPEPLYQDYPNSDEILSDPSIHNQEVYKWPYFDFHLPVEEHIYCNLMPDKGRKELLKEDLENLRDTSLRSVRPHDTKVPLSNKFKIDSGQGEIIVNMFSPKRNLKSDAQRVSEILTSDKKVDFFLNSKDDSDFY